MYYLLNSSGEIVAASNDFLSYLNVKSLIELYKKIDKEKIELKLDGDKLLIRNEKDETIKAIKQSQIVSSFGTLELIIINEDSEVIAVDSNESALEEEVLELDDIYQELAKKEEPKQELTAEDILGISAQEEDVVEESQPDEVLYNLTDEAPKELPKYIVDIDKNSSLLGVGKNDYREFIEEYKETLKNQIDDLLSSDDAKRNQAVKTAKHLTQNLHLPDELIEACDTIAKNSDTKGGVEELYALIENLELVESGGVDAEEDDAPLDIIDTNEPQEKEETQQAEDGKIELLDGESINLSDVAPSRFDFSVDEAAKELNLPGELVKEFIKDFIDQMHTETNNLIKAYEIGDLSRVQKIAHMLKGTSSNLRIVPLAESLAALQANDKLENIESLVKQYWGQFLSFKRQMADTLQ